MKQKHTYMEHGSSAEERTEKTLGLLENVQRSEAPPFLETRILQQVQNAQGKRTKRVSAMRYVLAAGMALLVAVNVTTWIIYPSSSDTSEQTETLDSSLARELGLTSSENAWNL